MTFRRIGHGRHHGERAERYPAVAAGVCPGRSAGRLPGRSAGSLDLPGHLPPVTGASAQVSGEMYLGGDPGLMTTSSHSHARGAGTGARTKDEAAVLAASGHLTDRDREANPPGSQAPRIDHRAARRARVRRRDHCQASAHTGASKVNHAVAA